MPADPLRPSPDAARPSGVPWFVWGSLLALAAALVGGRGLRTNASQLYRDLALALPLGLIGLSRAAPHRWGCTIMAALYALFVLALAGLMASDPRLMPLAFKLSRVMPPAFPLLLLAPAVALDLLRRLSPRWRVLGETLALGALVLAALAIVRSPLGGAPYGASDFGLRALVAYVAW
jgi:hypothetical protein